MPDIIIAITGPDAEQALAELKSNVEYDKLDVKIMRARLSPEQLMILRGLIKEKTDATSRD